MYSQRSFGKFVLWIFLVGLLQPNLGWSQTREEKVRTDRTKVEAGGFWIYNDLPKAYAEAKKTGKPILAIFRCIPCVECVKLDDDLVNQDPRVKPLLDKFVCVRIVSTNGLDLSLFQYDFDQSFAAFLFNADETIYGRFGTRSHQTVWTGDVSIEGFAKALEGALELHADYTKNKDILAAKRGNPLEFPKPELFPTLKGKYTSALNYEGDIVRSCIHCHQIGDAQRQFYLEQKKPIPEQILFSYPHPKSQGLILDPKERGTVLKVEPNTPAEKAGFQKGDRILTLNHQPILAIADVQWVLHQTAADGGTIEAKVQRGESQQTLSLVLSKGWRQREDLSWRASTWQLRRAAFGGMALEEVPRELREKWKLDPKTSALHVKHVGQYAPHNMAQKAGIRKGDLLLSFDGRTDFRRETDLLYHMLKDKLPGQPIPVTLLRDGKSIDVQITLQP